MSSYILNPGHGRVFNPNTDIEELISQERNSTKSLSCDYQSCNNISLFRLRVVRSGLYFLYIQFNFTRDHTYYIDNLEVSGKTVRWEFAFLQGSVKAILFAASLAGTCMFWFNLRKSKV